MASSPGWVQRFLTVAELDVVAREVRRAEGETAGEIRVHLEPRCPDDPLRRAVTVFERLGMHRTAARTGVLIYVAIEDQKLAVIGDTGIHARVPVRYWDALAATLGAHFREGRPVEGLRAAVRDVGEVLRRHFPRDRDDRNELTDEVSLG